MGQAGLYVLLSSEERDGERIEVFEATEHTSSPWGPMQHGGPVAAMLTRAMDRLRPRPGTRIARVTVDLLGPVPLGEVRVTARVARPGRRIELTQAVLEARTQDGGWRDYARGSAWRQATQATEDVLNHADQMQQPPATAATGLNDHVLPESWRIGGFVGAVDWRVGHRGTGQGDPTTAWVNLACDLVEGEEPSEVERLVALADTANGIGARLDPTRFAFLNTEMTVHLHSPPVGPWYGLESETSVGPDGVGMSAAVIHTDSGPIGRVAQSVLVERLAPS